jgi:S1-C subfamily serine protease
MAMGRRFGGFVWLGFFLAAMFLGATTVAALTEDEVNNIELYQRLSPGVVNITSTVLERDFYYNDVPRQGAGSGSIIDKRGYILTNHHVIEDARKLEVTLSSGKKYTAKFIGSDPDSDLAVLKINAPAGELTVVPMGSSHNLRVGQKVLAIGNPFGLGQTMTRGIISSIGRTIRAKSGVLVEDIVQTDASINPGNSGGPLIDSSGNLIGITSAIFSPTGASVGIGFAIPVDTARRVLQDLIEKGQYLYPWAGVTLMTITPGLTEALDLSVERGALVLEVTPGSPADKAGMHGGKRRVQVGNHIMQVGGDVIVRMDAEAVTDADQVIRKLRKLRAGTRVRFEVVRGRGESREVSVTLGEKPASGH